MNKIELELATKPVNNRPLVFEFRRCLFTAFFVLIPVQRLRIIFDLRWRDITLYDGNIGSAFKLESKRHHLENWVEARQLGVRYSYLRCSRGSLDAGN